MEREHVSDGPFKSYAQIHYYCHCHHFKEKLVEIRRKKAEEVINGLMDAKTKALENAIKLLEPRHRFVYTKSGIQVFDQEGNPLIVEQLPYYKEIKTAWEIIKTELGEPTNITKTENKNSDDSEVSKALDVIANLANGRELPRNNPDAVPGERGAASDSAETPATVQPDIHAEPSQK
jgi:hypothetical protein